MSTLLRYWYVFALALVLSVVAAVGLLTVRIKTMTLAPVAESVVLSREAQGAGERFKEWDFRTAELEDMRVKMEAQQEALRVRESELESWQARIQSEIQELNGLKGEILALREAINADILKIAESERRNLRNLAGQLAEMRPPVAIKILEEKSDEALVKLLSQMPNEASVRILSLMAEQSDEAGMRRVNLITDLLLNLE